jgi:hypothetical protein
MLDLRIAIEWSHALQEQSARIRVESNRLRADYKWLTFEFQQLSKPKLAPLSKGRGISLREN